MTPPIVNGIYVSAVENVAAQAEARVSVAEPLIKVAAVKAAHTFWQAGTATFIASAATIRSYSDVRDLALAAVVAGGSAALSFFKTTSWPAIKAVFTKGAK